MKLFDAKEHPLYLSKEELRKVFLAASIMTLLLYLIAIICSLCGLDIFILKYQNPHMDTIENFLRAHNIYSLATSFFLTLEFSIVISFVMKKLVNPLYSIIFYVLLITPAFFIDFPEIYYRIYPFIFYLIIPLIDQAIYKKHIVWKEYLFSIIRILIAVVVTLSLQAMITVIKAGYFDGQNHRLHLSAYIAYTIEYTIALSIILYTLRLFLDREKGDNKLWTTFQVPGGSSQTSKMQSQTSNTVKNLTKTQKNKIRFFYVRMYIIQLGTFLLVMILPFLLGKVLEFLVMYLAFCVTRGILGFKYSLHYKKESLCVTVGVIVFGILSLVVPFFNIVMIVAISLGAGLAILLHLSYKYKGFYLFNKIARPDKFAEIYVLFDEDLSRHHVLSICHHKGIDKESALIVADFAEGNKKAYLAKKYNYSEKTIERKLNEAIDLLKKKS